MPKVKFTKKNMPKSGKALVKALREAAKTTTPVDDLIELTRELVQMELKYKMPSDEFYKKFQKGEMGDSMEIMEWASSFEMHKSLQQGLESIVKKYYAVPLVAV